MRVLKGSEIDPPAYVDGLSADALSLLTWLAPLRHGRVKHTTGWRADGAATTHARQRAAVAELIAAGHIVSVTRFDRRGVRSGAGILYLRPRAQVRFPEDQPDRPARYRPAHVADDF